MQEGKNEQVDQIKMSDDQESKWRPLSISPHACHRPAPSIAPNAVSSSEKVLEHEKSTKVGPIETTDVSKSPLSHKSMLTITRYFRQWRQGPQTLYPIAQRQ